MYDLIHGDFVGKLETEKLVSGIAISLTSIIVRTENEFLIWDSSNYDFIGYLNPQGEDNKPVVEFLLAINKPVFCYSRVGSKSVFGILILKLNIFNFTKTKI